MDFRCKTAQRDAKKWIRSDGICPRRGNILQRLANSRKNSFFNYESPAQTAELQAQLATAILRCACGKIQWIVKALEG